MQLLSAGEREVKSWLGLALSALVFGCAALPTLTERPEDYRLFRASRVAPTLEERLSAAHRYLREVPGGPHTATVRSWFDKEEERYYLAAFDRLPNLYAYAAALPRGPHIEDVKSRITALEIRRLAPSKRERREDAQIAATEARLVDADVKRRAFVTVFKDWTARLTKIRSFGEPTSELGDETIFAFRLSEPRGACQGDRCRKLLELSYPVPGERELVERAAILEIQLDLERGLLARARLGGPELWTRLAEALSLTPLPSPTPEQRADAVNRASLLVRALLEPRFPAAECDARAEPPIVVERSCHGLRARMVAGQNTTDDDSIEIAPTGP